MTTAKPNMHGGSTASAGTSAIGCGHGRLITKVAEWQKRIRRTLQEMTESHLDSYNAMDVMKGAKILTPDEAVHLTECDRCHSWLVAFADLAIQMGISTLFAIPPLAISDSG